MEPINGKIISYAPDRHGPGWHIMFEFVCICGQVHSTDFTGLWAKPVGNIARPECPILRQYIPVELEQPFTQTGTADGSAAALQHLHGASRRN
jgi:hypothetical protein